MNSNSIKTNCSKNCKNNKKILIQLGNHWVFVHHNFQLNFFWKYFFPFFKIFLMNIIGHLFQFVSFLNSSLTECDGEGLGSCLLMIISVPFGLNDIFIGGECISIINISQFLNQCIHQFKVLVFLATDEFDFFFDNIIEAESKRQTKFWVDLDIMFLFSTLWICSECFNLFYVWHFFFQSSFLGFNIVNVIFHFNQFNVGH